MGIGKVERPAVFLDRDGVLTEDVFYQAWGEWEAPLRPQDVRLLPGASDACSRLSRAGYQLVLVSNQGGAAKGKATLEALEQVHRRFVELLGDAALGFCEFFYAYHHPRAVVDEFAGEGRGRKPDASHLLQAAERFGLDLENSWMIGDRDTDVECGKRAGTRTIRVENPHAGSKAGRSNPDYVSPSTLAAVEIVLSRPMAQPSEDSFHGTVSERSTD